MRVTAVGDSTFWGRISQEVQTDTRESPLKLRLSKLAGQISRLGYVAAALTGLIYIINMVLFENAFDTQVILSKLQDFSYVFETLFSALTLGLTVLVVAVPEGLPMMIAVVLSSNIKRMTADHVLVRKPVGIESAGSMNILFTDKTGTLTQGKLSVGQVILGDGTAFSSMERLAKKTPIVSQIFTHMACTNTLSTIGLSGHSNTWQALGGNATDRALLDYVLQKSKQKPRVLGQVQDLIPFDSTSKCSCAWVTWQGRRIFYIKGAPEKLLPHLTHMYDHMGRVVPLQPSTLQAIYQELTQNGHRVLMMAQSNQILPDKNSVIAGQWGELTLVCMVTLNDKIRSQAPKSVATLHRAGIHVVMMTGDNKETATAIAKAVGILTGKATATLPYVVDSQELAHMSDTEIQNILPKLCVVARALPSDKSRLVKLAQAQNLVVGMTGDGINDAPALKCADVGFAMGDGTQVAKDAGDIIILDNNLASIAKAVLYGRTIFKSIRKFITLQLTMNLCAMGVTMICPFVGVDTPVTVVQMLWINLIMDTLGGLAFAGEAPLLSYMEEAPKRRDEPILNDYMIHQICFLGGFTIALCLAFLKLPPIMQAFRQDSQDIYLLTAFFALFIFSSVFNCFNARTDRLKITAGLTQNKAFCLVMTGVLFIQVVFIYIGGQVLRTAPLTWQELWLTAAMAALVFPADLVRKIWWRLGGHSQGF